MKIRKKGLLYRLAQYGTFFDIWALPDKNTDICTFTRQVLIGLFFSVPMVIFLLSVTSCVALLPVFFLVLGLSAGVWIPEFWVATILIVSIAILIYVKSVDTVNNYVSEKLNSNETIKELKGFVKTNYKSFKEKTCILVELE